MPELAILRIYRPVWPYGAALPLMMDGRELTRLRSGRNWASYVEPGRHSLWVQQLWRSHPPSELVLAPGDDVQLETKFGIWTGRISLVRTDRATADPVHSPAPVPAVQVVGVTETHRSEEPIGTETRRINNTSGVGRVTRTIRVTKEWTRMVSLDLHASRNVSYGGQVGPNWLAFKTNIEQSLEHAYAISASRREEFAEEIGVEIEPGVDVTVILAWKRIWQHGVAHVLAHGYQSNVPFRMAIGVTFDQSSL